MKNIQIRFCKGESLGGNCCYPDKSCHKNCEVVVSESPQHQEQGELRKELKNFLQVYWSLYANSGKSYDEIIDEYLASQPAGEQTPAVEGELYRWVKASERLPKMETVVYLRINDVMGLGNFYEEDQCYYLYVQRNGAHDEFTKPFSSAVNKDVEWLEKLPSQPPPPLPVEQDSELKRLYEWIMDDNRKAAQTFFTAGWLRNCAREIEWRIKK